MYLYFSTGRNSVVRSIHTERLRKRMKKISVIFSVAQWELNDIEMNSKKLFVGWESLRVQFYKVAKNTISR